jgi:hypothetical protein
VQELRSPPTQYSACAVNGGRGSEKLCSGVPSAAVMQLSTLSLGLMIQKQSFTFTMRSQ